MADLSDASFTNVNDVETAQGAPVSEAVAQKVGSNENNLNTRLTTAESDIATNTSDIATNTAAIAALDTPAVQEESIVALNGASTRLTVSDTILFALVSSSFGAASHVTKLVTPALSAVWDDGSNTVTFSVSGANFIATESGTGSVNISYSAIIFS